jgi:hypothetical protein
MKIISKIFVSFFIGKNEEKGAFITANNMDSIGPINL